MLILPRANSEPLVSPQKMAWFIFLGYVGIIFPDKKKRARRRNYGMSKFATS